MAEVTEDLLEPRELNHPTMEIVKFTTASKSDFYYSRKFGIVDAAFACNLTTDSKEIQVSWIIDGVGRVKITLNTEEDNTTGYLTIIGRK